VGVDRDPIAICLAAANALCLDKTVALRLEDAKNIEIRDFTAWHMDPDRRPSGKRTSSLAWSSPAAADVENLLSEIPNAAVKLAPAADVPHEWENRCELEWVSRNRQCRQLTAWHGALAANPGKRKASVLTADGTTATNFVGAPNREFFHAKLDQYLFEPDAAVLAAHLGGAIAQDFGLSAVSAGIAYLTGPRPIDSPLLACFTVDEVLPMNMRKIDVALRERRIGRLEIKKRGVDQDPRRVRNQLRLDGDNEATLLLTKLNGRHAAILARRFAQLQHSLSPVP
jgi:hypothetical protein